MSPVTMVRDLPDAQVLVREVLLQSGAEVGPDIPPDLVDQLPRFACYRSGGGVFRPRLMDRPLITVIALGRTYEEGRDLGATGETLLLRAWAAGYHSANGRIGHVQVLSGSSWVQLANTPYGVFRFDATYRINVRPA